MNGLAIHNILLSLSLALYLDMVVLFKGLADSAKGLILKACEEDSCEVQDVVSNKTCATKGGLSCAFVTCLDNIDIEASSSLVTDTGTSCTMSGFVTTGGSWSQIGFSKKSASYSFKYTKSEGSYELIVDMLFDGKDPENTKAFCKLVEACNFVMVLFDRNCNARVVGLDWVDDQLQELGDDFGINEHDDNSGSFEGDSPFDSLQWSGKGECAPLFLDMTKADFEAQYV